MNGPPAARESGAPDGRENGPPGATGSDPVAGLGLGPVPAEAEIVFGSALPLAVRYAALLAGPGVERGLIGPAEAGRIWDRHLLNCAVLAELIPPACRLADLGSGAGLPGIVLAMLRPEADVTLVEPMARRVAFLTECLTDLGLDRVQVIRGRAEDLAGQIAADVVTARAVAPLSRLAGWAVAICRPGGTVLAVKGATAREDLAEAKPVLRQLGITGAVVLQVGGGRVSQPATVVRFQAPPPPRAARASGHGRAGGRSGAGGRGGAAGRGSRAGRRGGSRDFR